MSVLATSTRELQIDSLVFSTADKGTVRYAIHFALIACAWLFGSRTVDGAPQCENPVPEHVISALRKSLPLDGSISLACVSPDGALVAGTTHDDRIGVFRLDGTAPPIFLRGHGGMIYSMAFRNDSQVLVTSSLDRMARMFDLRRGTEDARFPMERCTSLLVTRDNATLVSGGGPFLHFIDLNNHYKRRRADVNVSAYRHLKSSANGNTLAAVGPYGRIWFLNPQGDIIREFDSGHQRTVTDAKFIRGGVLFATSSSDHHVKVWDTATGRLEHDLHEDRPEGCIDRVYAFAHSAKDDAIMTYSGDGKLRLWNLSLAKVERTTVVDMDGHLLSHMGAACFSPKSDYLVIGTDSGLLLIFGIADLW